MGFTPEQIKGRIKSVAKQNNADARTLMRIYIRTTGIVHRAKIKA